MTWTTLVREQRRVEEWGSRVFVRGRAGRVRCSALLFHPHPHPPSCRGRRLPPHLFRDAGQLVLWRLLEGGSDRVGVGTPHNRLSASTPPASVHTLPLAATPPKGSEPDTEARDPVAQKYPAARVLPFGLRRSTLGDGRRRPCGPCTEIHYDRVGGRDAASLVTWMTRTCWKFGISVSYPGFYNREDNLACRPPPRPPRRHRARHGAADVDPAARAERLRRRTCSPRIFPAVTRRPSPPPTGARRRRRRRRPDMAYRASWPTTCKSRTLSFAIADGARPGAEGANTCSRRVLRRAVRLRRETLSAPARPFRGPDGCGRGVHGRRVPGAGRRAGRCARGHRGRGSLLLPHPARRHRPLQKVWPSCRPAANSAAATRSCSGTRSGSRST